MTLSTEVYVLEEIDPREVFAECRRLLRATAEHPIQDEDDGDGTRTLSHPPGIGLDAWLMLHYRFDGPLRAAHDASEHEKVCPGPDECDEYGYHRPAAWLSVWFDTAYSYRGEHGEGCSQLHAGLVAELGTWLDARKVAWSWKNEYDGAIYGGDERYTKLTELLGDGEVGERWFSNIVMPAIQRLGGELV